MTSLYDQSANAGVAHAAAAAPNHLSAEVQDFGTPSGLSIDQEFVDGGIVLGDQPGVGIHVDASLIEDNQRSASWLLPDDPHVRSPRAGLQLARERDSVGDVTRPH